MCECLDYEDGDRYQCVVCADMDKALRAEYERLKAMIEIEREGQRSMARALAEIHRLSRLDVAAALAAPKEEKE